MPGDPLPRARGWQVGAFGLFALMLLVAWWSIEASSVPNGYLARRGWEVEIDGPWRFPYAEVRTWLTAMVIEGLFGIWVLAARWSVSLALRAFLLALGGVMIFICMAPLMMHASAPFTQHVAWLVLATGWLLFFAICAAIASRLGLDRRAASRIG